MARGALGAVALAVVAALAAGCARSAAERGPRFIRCTPARAFIGPTIEYHSDTVRIVEGRRRSFVTVWALNLEREVTLSEEQARWYDCERLPGDPQAPLVVLPEPL